LSRSRYGAKSSSTKQDRCSRSIFRPEFVAELLKPISIITFCARNSRIIVFLPLPKAKGKSEVGNEAACREESAEKLEELTVRESVQGGEINLIKVKVRALAFTKEKETEKRKKEGHRKKLEAREDEKLIVSQSFK